MRLLGRMARLWSADLNAVMDGLEEPEALLLQAIREMEHEISEGRRQLQLRRAGIKDLQLQTRHVERRIERLDGELDLCFQAGNDELARSLIRRKLQLERLAECTSTKLDDATADVQSVAARQQACEQMLSEMKDKAEIVGTKSAGEHDVYRGEAFDSTIANDEIEAALLREKQARRGS